MQFLFAYPVHNSPPFGYRKEGEGKERGLLMKDKGCLIYEKKGMICESSLFCGLDGITIEHLIPILTFFDSLKL